MLKVFYSTNKGWLEENILFHVHVLLTKVQTGKTEFYYNENRILIYYMCGLSEATAVTLVDDLIGIIKVNKKQMLLYYSPEVFETLRLIVTHVRNQSN